MRVSILIVSTFAAMIVATTAFASTVTGQASVIDGDTFEIDGISIRLHAVDAPEIRQECLNAAGERWRCGEEAAEVLYQRVRRRTVQCVAVGPPNRGRMVARCSLDGIDLAAWMVRQGLAVAATRYGDDYVNEEAEAKREGRGMWAGRFVLPEQWRRGQRG
jgi:endonuclease YncB( thermonuclease family)